MLGALQPGLESVPGFKVESGYACFLGQSRHHCPGLLLSVSDSQREQASLILRVELDGRGRDHEACWSFPLDEAWLDALRGLLYGLITYSPLGEQRAHQVSVEVAVHASGLVDDQEAMPYGLLGVGQGAVAHGRKGVVGAHWEEGEHSLHQVALAAARGAFEGNADRTVQQAGGQRQVQQLGYPLLPGYARASQVNSEAP